MYYYVKSSIKSVKCRTLLNFLKAEPGLSLKLYWGGTREEKDRLDLGFEFCLAIKQAYCGGNRSKRTGQVIRINRRERNALCTTNYPYGID